jgi:DNA gyrase subunit B
MSTTRIRDGIPVEPVKRLGESIRGYYDPLVCRCTIFTETTTYNFDVLANRIRELAFLNSGITIILRDERLSTPKELEFKFDGGIRHFVTYLNENKTVLHKEPVYISGERDDIVVEVALQYNDSFSEIMFSFVNDINTREGGNHLVGFKSALTRVLNEFLKTPSLQKNGRNPFRDDVREGSPPSFR